MKVSVVHNEQTISQQCAELLCKKIKQTRLRLDEQNPDVVISVGGDGTLLHAFHQYETQLEQVRFIGVHTGHLGFYTDWRDYEIDALIESLLFDEGEAVSYPLLAVEVETEQEQQAFIALNESTVRCINRTLIADVSISGQWFERFLGDGLAVSTPTGSTAYNKSLGGAVIQPQMDVFQMTEMAALNNSVFHTLGSPMLLAGQEKLTLYLERKRPYIVTVDCQTFSFPDLKRLSYTLSSRRIRFAKYRHTAFWNRVNEAFLR